MGQRVLTAKNQYAELKRWLLENGCGRLLLVCGKSIRHLSGLNACLKQAEEDGLRIIRFQDFQPNPLYENAVEGVRVFRAEGCDSIMAAGGGSAMDVAKCIRLYTGLPGDGTDGAWLKREPPQPRIPFLAMPTTAGSGSEATRFAVIYRDGVKQSVAGEGCLPDAVLLDPDALKSLPLYQRKATMMDAFCHAAESFWSVKSTEESKAYSKEAIRLLLRHREGYLANTPEGNAEMLRAANLAGKAINITQTTAGHAMCYQITGLFGCAHGHAAALCNRTLLSWLVGHTDRCTDPRGEAYLKHTLQQLAEAMGCEGPAAAAARLDAIVRQLELEVPAATERQFAILKQSVNPERLKNFPAALDEKAIDDLYHRILNGEAT